MKALRLDILRRLKALHGRNGMSRTIEGWRRALAQPGVAEDLCVMGHVFEPDTDPETGRLYDDAELRARAARRSLVLHLLARGEVSQDELNLIRQEDMNHDGFADDDV